MRKLLLVAVLGVGALGLMLATPATSEAADIRIGIGIGNDGCYAPSYGGGYRPAYYGGYSGYNYGQSYYGGYANPGYNSYYRPAPIVHPETLHWTPNRGVHTHGHIHVPHRGHYHTRPY